jgi:hypothetical protein
VKTDGNFSLHFAEPQKEKCYIRFYQMEVLLVPNWPGVSDEEMHATYIPRSKAYHTETLA